MTTTYDPHHPQYLDEADTRLEMARAFDVCNGCRRCTTLCTAFPTLFDTIDALRRDGTATADAVDAVDAGRMTPAQQDRVVDGCLHCSMCVQECPYSPGRSDENVDIPRLMLRATAMRREGGHLSLDRRVATQVIGRVEGDGRIATRVAVRANRLVESERGSVTRRALAKITGVSAVRLVPPFTRQRFSTWFNRRPRVRIGKRQGSVTLFPTCLVEHHEPAIGHDLVKVYERNGIEVSLVESGCCGAPWLHAGAIERFQDAARKVVTVLADEARKGNDIVVPQPTCSYVLRHEYQVYIPGPDADIVAERTFDSSEYLMRLHRSGGAIDTDFEGDVPATITYHAPCHLRAQRIGLRSRDLLKLTGANVQLVQQCSGMGAAWGLQAANEVTSTAMAAELGHRVLDAGGEAVAGDCHLANTVIVEQTGRAPSHPMQVLARAYGIAEEQPR